MLVWLIVDSKRGSGDLCHHWFRQWLVQCSVEGLCRNTRVIIYDKWALLQVMAWCPSGTKPLPEPMLILFMTPYNITWTQWVHAKGTMPYYDIWCHHTGVKELTHWGLLSPFVDIDLGQHWFRQWLVAWWHQAITWTNVDLSSARSSGIHLRTISWDIRQPPFTKVSLKFTYLKLIWNLLRANELRIYPW